MKLILASSSPRRADILHHAGISFTVLSSAVDETPYANETPQQMVQRLADAKAELVSARAVGSAIIIAADTVVMLDKQILGKPRSTDEARRMLEMLSGRTHSVITAVTLLKLPEMERRRFVETTLVHFARLTSEDLSRYLATGEPSTRPARMRSRGTLADTFRGLKVAISM